MFTILKIQAWKMQSVRANSLMVYELIASMVYLDYQLHSQNFLIVPQHKLTPKIFVSPAHFTVTIFLFHLHVTVKGEAGLTWSWWLCGQSRTAFLLSFQKHLQLACQSYADLRKSHPEHPGSPTVTMPFVLSIMTFLRRPFMMLVRLPSTVCAGKVTS